MTIRKIVLISERACDPALDLEPPAGLSPEESAAKARELEEKLSAYLRTRSDEDLARLPIAPGKHPVLWHVGKLPAGHYGALSGIYPLEKRLEAAFRWAVLAYERGGEPVVRAQTHRPAGTDLVAAKPEWVEHAVELMGDYDAVLELGHYALERARTGDTPRDGTARRPFFGLPGGLLPAR